jgi:hypothetical protein
MLTGLARAAMVNGIGLGDSTCGLPYKRPVRTFGDRAAHHPDAGDTHSRLIKATGMWERPLN